MLGILLLLAGGCEPTDEGEAVGRSPAPSPATSPTPQADAPLPTAAETPSAAPTGPEPTPDPETSLSSPEPAFQPDGVPFPLPDPLPPGSTPHALADWPAPQPGPDPLEFWLGGSGHDDGHFSYPRAMTITSTGTLYVVDKGGQIQKWSHEGRLLATVRTPEISQGKPTGLSIAPDGNLLVADTHYCRVLTYSPDLELLDVWGAPGPNPGQFMMITWVVQGSDGTFYVTDYGDLTARVQILDAEHNSVRTIGSFGTGPEQFRRPMALWLDEPKQELYVADAVNHRIAVFSLEGELLRSLGELGRGPGQLNFPYHVVLDEVGRMWIAEFGNQRISVLSSQDGSPLGAWGQAGRQLGRLARPWAVALGPSERVWVLDSGNDRLYALTRESFLGGGAE